MRVVWIGVDDSDGCTKNWHDLRIELRDEHGVILAGPGYSWEKPETGPTPVSRIEDQYSPDWIVIDDCNANGYVRIHADRKTSCKLAFREHDWWNRHRRVALDNLKPDLVLGCYDRDPDHQNPNAKLRNEERWVHVPHPVNTERFCPNGERTKTVGFYGKTGPMYRDRGLARQAIGWRGVRVGDVWIGTHGGYWRFGDAHDDGVRTFYNENLAEALRRCKAVWVDSPDTFGACVQKFFEAAASGCQLIGSPPHPNAYAFPTKYMDLIDPGDIDAYLDGMLANEPDRAARTGECRQDLIDHHSVPARARQMMRILKERL